jgi:hypothetical protein
MATDRQTSLAAALMGRKGGRRRADVLTKARMVEIAHMGAQAKALRRERARLVGLLAWRGDHGDTQGHGQA